MHFFKKLQENLIDGLALGASAGLVFAGTSLVAGPVIGAAVLAGTGMLTVAMAAHEHRAHEEEGKSKLGRTLTQEFFRRAGIRPRGYAETDGQFGMASTTNGRVCVSEDVVKTASLEKVAMLIGHEVGHFIHHTAEANVDVMNKLNVVTSSALALFSLVTGNIGVIPLLVASGTAGILLSNAHNRHIELRCDRNGMEQAGARAARACVHERETIVERTSTLRSLQNNFRRNSLGYRLLGLLDDHPSLESRLKFIDRYEARQEPGFSRRREIELYLQFGHLANISRPAAAVNDQPQPARATTTTTAQLA